MAPCFASLLFSFSSFTCRCVELRMTSSFGFGRGAPCLMCFVRQNALPSTPCRFFFLFLFIMINQLLHFR
ncbi:Uncharacterized protein APZ42_002583 [Daphnia magna]|uniref:Uncharacterized protein n=1 Tax=Daphnia magna TaxID=35525 RepID=A0A164I6C7_9CRUS|nr:Uncharacterized protein APZ42_002583 [Daphnia magna]